MRHRPSLRQTAKRLLPKGTKRHRIARLLYRAARKAIRPEGQRVHTINYEQWVERCEPHAWSVPPEKFTHQPLISIIVPAYNTPDKYLYPLLQSVQDQLYGKWELCVADGSTTAERAAAIQNACAADKRIKYKRLDKNYGIVGNTNQAIDMAKGSFVAFLDHDDCLSPHALMEIVIALNDKPKTDLFYSDEDKLSDDGSKRSLPFFKPGWSPQLLESVNYMTHFTVVRRTILKKVGPLREGFDGGQDYDFILRVTDATQNVTHIPKILYHWRLAEGSTSGPIENKNYADAAGQRALRDHVKRRNIRARVLGVPELPTNYRLQYKLRAGTKASIIIPFKDKADLTSRCVQSILQKTTHPDYEIILISNNSIEKKTHAWLGMLKKQNDPRVRIFYHDVPFNYSAINNFGRAQAKGDYLVLLNNDTEVITGDWLSELLGVASQPWAGAVGPLLLYPNQRIQHAGIVLGMDTMAGLAFRGLHEDALTPFGRPYWVRNYLALTGACLAVKTTKFDEAGGLDEKLVTCGNDIALCISLYKKGYRNTYWPFAKLYHYESQSVGSYKYIPSAQSDYDRSLIYYQPYLKWNDPYFSPNLSLAVEQIALREDYSGEFN